MMKVKILVGVLIFLTLVNLAMMGTFAYFRFVHPPFDEFRNHPMDSRMPPPILELGEKERGQMFKLMRGFIDDSRPMRDSVRLMENELFQLFQQNPVVQEKIDSKLKDIAAVKVEISQRAAKDFVQAKTFLTPQQQEHFFKAIMQSMPDFGPGGGPQQGPMKGKDSLGMRLPDGQPPPEFGHPPKRP